MDQLPFQIKTFANSNLTVSESSSSPNAGPIVPSEDDDEFGETLHDGHFRPCVAADW
jgi:hypothetical protein